MANWKDKFKHTFAPAKDSDGNEQPLVLNEYLMDLIIKWIEKEFVNN